MRSSLLAVGIAFVLFGAVPVNARTLDVYTLDAPPMVNENGSDRGFVADILLEAVKRAGFKVNFVFLPWPRSQQKVADGEDFLIIPLVRNAAREDNFTWIAPVYRIERSFATLGAPIDSFEQAKRQESTILVGIGSAQEEMLVQAGIEKNRIHHQVIGISEVEMLAAGRVDAWFNGTPETLWKWEHSGQSRKPTIGKTITADEVYLACSKRCSPALSRAIAKAVEDMRRDGTIQRIIGHYPSAG